MAGSSSCSNRLPLVQADLAETKDWLAPSEIKEAFQIQPTFVCPDYGSLRLTVLSVFIPGMIFMRCLLRETARVEEEDAAPRVSRSCAAWCSLWALSALLGFVAAACRNPGVVPRPRPRPDEAQKAKEDSTNFPARYVTINGALIKQRWCQTCRVYRPLRAKHCSYCDRCVFRFDHHCTWLGNCIGLGNYRSFLFLISATALFFGHSALIACRVLRCDLREGCAAGLVVGRLQVLRRIFIANGFKSLYIAYAIVMFLAFFVLILYHAIIIAQNLTTNEHVRDYYLQRNPFDITCADNYRQVFCCPYGRVLPVGPQAAHLQAPAPRRPTSNSGSADNV